MSPVKPRHQGCSSGGFSSKERDKEREENTVELRDDVVGHLDRVVVGDLGAVAGTDAFSAVHEHHGDDGQIKLGLDALSFLDEVVAQQIVVLFEDETSDRGEISVDVSRRSGILSAQ